MFCPHPQRCSVRVGGVAAGAAITVRFARIRGRLVCSAGSTSETTTQETTMAKRMLNMLRGTMHTIRYNLMHSACCRLERADISPRTRF